MAKKSGSYIDAYDLERLSDKEYELRRIIFLLKQLKELDAANVNKKEIDTIISHLEVKRKRVNKKVKQATDNLIEEAEFLFKACGQEG